MNISEKIYRLRTENNLTQVEFGKIAGATDKAVSTWERGEKEPRMKSVQKICLHFGIDLNKFIDAQSDVYTQDEVQSISHHPASFIRALKSPQVNIKNMTRVAWLKKKHDRHK